MTLTPEQKEFVLHANDGLRFFYRGIEFIDTPDYTGWRDTYYEYTPLVRLQPLALQDGGFVFDANAGHRIINGLLNPSPLFFPVYTVTENFDQDNSTPE